MLYKLVFSHDGCLCSGQHLLHNLVIMYVVFDLIYFVLFPTVYTTSH